VIPRRPSARWPSTCWRVTIRKSRDWILRPCDCTATNSRRLRRRSSVGNRRSCERSVPCRWLRLLAPDRHAKALTALGATTRQDGPPVAGLHARPESMGALSALVMRLVRTLHDDLLRSAECGSIYESSATVKNPNPSPPPSNSRPPSISSRPPKYGSEQNSDRRRPSTKGRPTYPEVKGPRSKHPEFRIAPTRCAFARPRPRKSPSHAAFPDFSPFPGDKVV